MTICNSQQAPKGEFLVRDLKSRGWTPQLIARFLGRPDTALRSPAGGRPAGLYDESRVLAAERSVEFYRAKRASLERAKTLKSALFEKQAAVVRYAASLSLTLPDRSLDDLLSLAGDVLVERAISRYGADRELRLRFAAVEIAIEGLGYADALLDVYDWHPGVRRARTRLYERKLELVAATYPALEPTCRLMAGSRKEYPDEKAAA